MKKLHLQSSCASVGGLLQPWAERSLLLAGGTERCTEKLSSLVSPPHICTESIGRAATNPVKLQQQVPASQILTALPTEISLKPAVDQCWICFVLLCYLDIIIFLLASSVFLFSYEVSIQTKTILYPFIKFFKKGRCCRVLLDPQQI